MSEDILRMLSIFEYQRKFAHTHRKVTIVRDFSALENIEYAYSYP